MTSGESFDVQEQLVLSDLLNRVLDKGVVIGGDVIISVADIDLIHLGLTVVLSGVETDQRRRSGGRAIEAADVDPSVLPSPGER